MAEYVVRLRDEGGTAETAAIEAADLAEAVEAAEEEARDWARGGDWGADGASVCVWWALLEDEDGEGEGEEVDSGSVLVEIEPDHAALIEAACGGTHTAEWDRCCGDSPEAHDWTGEGEGGCDSNPGVWSTGGTSMLFVRQCRTCGLRRRESITGCQRNPGERDTVEYTMPDSWCAECESEAGSQEHAEVEE